MYRLILAAAIFLAGVTGGWQVRSWKAGWVEARASRGVIRAMERAGAVTADAGARHEARAGEIRNIYRTLVREVPVHVPPDVVRACVVPAGLVRLLDSAAEGVPAVSDPAGEPDDAPAAIGRDTVAGSVVENYGTCNEARAQLTALQNWIRAQDEAGPR